MGVTTGVLALCSAALPNNLKALLQAKYGQETQAMQRRDLPKIKSIFAPNYTAVQHNGPTANLDQVMTQFYYQGKALERLQWPRQVVYVNEKRGVATVMVKGHLSAYLIAKPKRHLELIGMNEDIWRKVKGVWLLEKSQMMNSEALIDGKRAPKGKIKLQ